jgi:HK97 family phage major capsid protein
MSNEILEAVREHGEKFDREVKALDDKLERSLNELAQKMETATGDGRGDRGNKGNPLAKLADDSGMQALRNGNAKSAIVTLDGSVGLLCKSTVVGDTAGTSEEGYNVAPQRDPRLANDPRRALSLLDFLPSMRVTSNSFEFNRLTGYSSAAGYQASEGDAKPEGALPTDLITASIATIAHHIPASRQVLSDVPALQQQISSLLQYGVRAKLEREILLGAGGVGVISGLTDSGNYTAYTAAASGDTLADAVAKAEATMLAAGWRPNVIVVHPDDWRDARQERADAGAGVYIAGSWRDPAPPSIWSIPVITNPAITAGNFLIMDSSQVMVLDRMQATVEVGTINDQFTRNCVTVLAELRAGLAVFAPGAVMYGDVEA